MAKAQRRQRRLLAGDGAAGSDAESDAEDEDANATGAGGAALDEAAAILAASEADKLAALDEFRRLDDDGATSVVFSWRLSVLPW